MPNRLSNPAPHQAISRAAGTVASAMIAAALVFSGVAGCGTPDTAAPARAETEPTRRDSRPLDLVRPPTTTPTVPATLPAISATRPTAVEVEELVPATGPATDPLPTTQAATEPATQASTQPATQATTQSADLPAELSLLAEASPGNEAVAVLIEQFALELAGSPAGEVAQQRRGEALMTLAVRLAPRNERLARRLVQLRLGVAGAQGALEALEHYRTLAPGDELAQIRYIDLTVESMQSADDRVSYLVQVVQSERVADAVRSHAASMAAVLLQEALEAQRSHEMIQEAVSLNPYNLFALELDYERLLSMDAAREQRVAALARLVRANVMQPAVLTRLAEEYLAAGLIEEANSMYSRARQAYSALNLDAPPSFLNDVAAVQLLTNRPDAARRTVDSARLDSADPATGVIVADQGLVRVLSGAQLGADEKQLAIDYIDTVLNRQLSAEWVAGNWEAVGQPSDGPAPFPAVVQIAQQLREDGDAATVQGYAASLMNRAWLDVYFLQQPTPPEVLQALELLVPAENRSLVRLRGWNLWRSGDVQGATEKLSAIADSDPLSALGLLLIEESQGGQIDDDLLALLEENPTGIVGAFIAQTARPRGIVLRPGEDAGAVREAGRLLDPALFDLLDREDVGQFYTVTADPLRVAHDFGEPLLAQVTIRNTGRHVLTVGPQGVIQPTIRLDALLKGGMDQRVPGSNFSEVANTTRLAPGEKIERVVRLDGPRLTDLLESAPQLGLTIEGDVTVNPMVVRTEEGNAFITGPAGMMSRFRRIIDRRGLPLDLADPGVRQAFQTRLSNLRGGTPIEQVRATQMVLAQINWLGGYISRREQEGATAEELGPWRQMLGELVEAMRRAATAADVRPSADVAAQAWVKTGGIVVADEQARQVHLRQLLGSAAPEARAIGVFAASAIARDRTAAREMIQPLAVSDPDPTVRRFASATLEVLESAEQAEPQTQPTTDPAADSPVPPG